MLKIAVIGTAGRGDDANRLLSSDFDRMCTTVQDIIKSITNEPWLISGGAAWADHVAVRMYNTGLLNGNPLQLHLPAKWDFEKARYVGNPNKWMDAGAVSNLYHERFSRKTGIDSLVEIDMALTMLALSSVGKGFHDRNSEVAKAQAVIALTFGKGSQLKDGGTADTFGKYLKRTPKNVSFHVDLNDWTVHTPATL